MKRLYLLRHGQTEFNVKKLVQGRCDSPLTNLGRQQAQTAAAWLKAHGVTPGKVVSSPLGRAMDTASLVACELLGPDAAVEPCEGIIERSYGSFEEGKNFLQKEFSSYSATRGVYLKDASSEGLSAKYADGILTVTVPKIVEKKNVTKISIE